MLASIVGFVGNEIVAIFRIRVGRQIGSAALVADGYHARVDGWTSLAVLLGAIGVWAGYPLADPIVGLLISAAIFVIVWQSAKAVLTRMLDGVEQPTISELRRAAQHASGVIGVEAVRARWLGHRLQAEMRLGVEPALSVADARKVAVDVEEHARAHLPALERLLIEIVPASARDRAQHQPKAEPKPQH